MPGQEEFLKWVREALSHLYDYRYLESCPLGQHFWPDAASRAEWLHRLFLESIERLYPAGESAEHSSRTKGYELLVYRYVEEQSIEQVMQALGCSRRQFFREQGKAVAMLAAMLHKTVPKLGAAGSAADGLLDAEAERCRGERDRIDVATIVRSVADLAEALAAKRGVTVDYNLERGLPPIFGNRTLLRQVFVTALGSLVSQTGVIRVCVQVQRAGDNAVQVTFVGNGRGGEERESIDYNCDPVPAALRHLVELVDGSWVTAGAGVSACRYCFTIPVDSRRIVLVIDDNEGVIRTFERCLRGYDYRVIGAMSGSEALRLAREGRPDCITIDVLATRLHYPRCLDADPGWLGDPAGTAG
jgi:hypothetical protein